MMFKLFRKYTSLEKQERRILHHTFFWLMYASLLARMIPLRWFNHVLGEFNTKNTVELNSFQTGTVNAVMKNMRRCKRRLPWKVKCFEEAITVKKVLEKHRIQSTLFLGVDKNDENELIAHAWLKAGNRIVAGDRGVEKFVVVGFYT